MRSTIPFGPIRRGNALPEPILAPLAPHPVPTATRQSFRAPHDAVVALELPPGTRLSGAEHRLRAQPDDIRQAHGPTFEGAE
jgi:hypothetical protein